MKTRIYFMITAAASVLLIGLLFGSAAHAQATRVGFVDLRQIITTSDLGKQAAADFKKAFEKKRAVIQQTEAELKQMKDAIDKQRSVLKEEALKEKEMDYQRHFRDYQRLVNDSNEELAARDQQLSQKLIPEVMKIVNTFGEKEGYTMIIDINNPIVIYHARANDLTKRIVAELNKKKR